VWWSFIILKLVLLSYHMNTISPFSSLRIAVQSRGRLREESLNFLRSLGLEFEDDGRLMLSCRNIALDIIFLRNEDIPEYVSRGACDFGIVGENILEEKNVCVELLYRLDFAQCALVLAAPRSSEVKGLKDLEGARIATSYPETLRRYLQQCGISAAVIVLRGSVEIAPQLNLADAICDLTQTGSTLREHDLVPFETLLDSHAVLIESPFRRSQRSLFVSRIPSL